MGKKKKKALLITTRSWTKWSTPHTHTHTHTHHTHTHTHKGGAMKEASKGA
jgi:hypothetical protein